MCCCRRSERHCHCHQHHDRHCECQGERERESACECGSDSAEQKHGESCGCEGHHGFRRCYRSKAEMISELESYLAELEAEAQAVKERLGELRS